MSVLRATACAAVLAMAGCGAGGEAGPGPAAGGGAIRAVGGQEMVDAQRGLARCLRRHGVPVPDPGSQGGFEFDPREEGVSEAALERAERRCRRYSEALAAAAPQESAEDVAADRERTLGFARCMRDQGQDVPDPRPGTDGRAVEVPGGAREDPAFLAASERCEHFLREGRP